MDNTLDLTPRLEYLRTRCGDRFDRDDVNFLLSVIDLHEQTLTNIYDELGCERDNESALMAIDELKRRSDYAYHPLSRYSPNASWQSGPVWDLFMTHEALASFYNTLDDKHHGLLAGVAVKWLATAEREDGNYDVKVMCINEATMLYYST